MSPIPVGRSVCATLVISVIAAIVAQATEAQSLRPVQDETNNQKEKMLD